MNSAEHRLGPPHFVVADRDGVGPETEMATRWREDRQRSGPAGEVGALLMRGAECLTAALIECTAQAGLNEARFRVLDALQRRAEGECSQSELAVQLLQSESNLSTLLERMSGDGLIDRHRSQTDRRRSLIRMTPLGIEAFAQANRARTAKIARLLRIFLPQEVAQLEEGLRRLVGILEAAPEVRARRASGVDPVLVAQRPAQPLHARIAATGASCDD